jgi:iron complex outermembrane receptor protein
MISGAKAVAGFSEAASLTELSLEELSDVKISSVSKKSERLSDAPAAAYVISRDDIVRSGATSIPEMLRLAPNLQVAQLSSSSYAISARGFNGALANKLLVMIDGRSVYSPLYAGVYWDMQDVLSDNVERIEVISGPGATLWGANAVNGVINIITRPSSDTQGGLLSLGAGDQERAASLQYGGRITEDLTYRAYVKWFHRDDVVTQAKVSAHDAWFVPQGGFRFDWTPGDDRVTLQGDFYDGVENHATGPDDDVAGRNVLVRWAHAFGDGSELQTQAYYDRAQRFSGPFGFALDTYDFNAQYSFKIGAWNDIVSGAGYRLMRDRLVGAPTFFFRPANRQLGQSNVFVQDTLTLSSALKVTLGLKLEDEPYVGLEVLPSARVALKASEQVLLWAAVSRAVRAPTRFDRDIVQKIGAIDFLIGGPTFDSEKVVAYEAGTRVALSPRFSFSVSTFYNVYTDLQTVEYAPNGLILPLRWANMMKGNVYGVEAWANYHVSSRWHLAAGFNVLHKNLSFLPGSSGLTGVGQSGNDPDHQVSLRSTVYINDALTWELDGRYVAALPNPRAPGYVELDSRVGWKITPDFEVAVTGSNLLHRYHREIRTDSVNNAIPRSVFVETKWRF